MALGRGYQLAQDSGESPLTSRAPKQQAVVGDGHAVRVPSYVVQHLLGSGEGRFGVTHPLGTPRLRDLTDQRRFWQGLSENTVCSG